MEEKKQSSIDFSEFVKKNRDKILRVTPQNPSVKRDDEWVKESEWDKYNRHLMEV